MKLMKFFTYEINSLPEQYTQDKNFIVGPLHLYDLYEIIRVRGAEKQAMSHRNGLEKLAVSLRNWLEK